jgi:HEPN domain-containing protein
MHSRELAELFFRKARQDEFVLDKLISDPTSPDEVIGFHAQQAVEKMLKAVLALHAVRLGKIHEIGQLRALLRKNGIAHPSEFDELDRLSPFAADFRYKDLPSGPEHPFDRMWAADSVRRVKAWAEAAVRG